MRRPSHGEHPAATHVPPPSPSAQQPPRTLQPPQRHPSEGPGPAAGREPEPDAAAGVVTEGLARLIELLAHGAPAEEFGEPAAEARLAGAAPAAVARLERAARTALRVRDTLAQHRRREAQLAALYDTAGDLAAPRDLDSVLRAIVHRARMLLSTDTAYLTLGDDEAGDTYMRVTDGSISPRFQRLRLGLGEGLGGLVAQTVQPYASTDYRTDTRFRHTPEIDAGVGDEGLVGILGVPLRLGPRVIGVLFAADRAPRRFAADEVALLCSLAAHAAVAIDAARRLEDTRRALAELNAANETIRAHNDAMRRAEEAHDRLTDLVLRGAGVSDVAAAVGEVLGGGICLFDADGTELARHGTAPLPHPTEAVRRARAGGRAIPEDGNWVCAVAAGAEPLGTLVLTGRGELPDADRRLFERAGVVAALLLLLRRSAAEAEDRVRGELVVDLLSRPDGDAAALVARGRRLGLELLRPHAVLVARQAAGSRSRLAPAAARFAASRGGVSGEHAGCLVLLLPDADPSSSARRAAAWLGESARCPVTVGAAGPAVGPAAIARAHAEAVRCLSALAALGREGEGAAGEDLGFLGVLLGDREGPEAFVRSTLGPLLEYDERRGTDLLRTVEAYFARGGAVARAADDLHVHPNTVAQRLERVAQLLGRGWREPSTALEVQLALRLWRLTQAPGG
ncbi:helix-turn-helix domain-containing protein [Allostreptomyces psammosilenae]|uniref:GAF domain-containing protein n=1 Tax=Allostreptomyces psammosilenae TaxID=1892865 RepID=A0A852ZZW9_9ACTN|nr:helix-turn-helix domain-containing protein [Allostreptomyces psammosilenae]NYI07387.1 GAF domain-containing protein [Allostreptomyces psammosilenae]